MLYCRLFWHGMSPDEKQQVVRVVDESSELDAGLGAWTPACLRKLNQDCHIPMKDVQHNRLCYIVGKELPETLSLSGSLGNAAEHAMQAQEKAGAALVKPVTYGLKTYTRKPEGVSGMDLFVHTCDFRRRHAPRHKEPSSYLCCEMTDTQRKLLAPSVEDLTMREIMKDAGGEGATLKLAKRKLDRAGYINAHCNRANALERIKRLKQGAQLASSIAAISEADRAEKSANKAKNDAALLALAPAALEKLEKKEWDCEKITKKEIISIAWRVYAKELKESMAKPELAKTLKSLIRACPSAIRGGAPANLDDDDDGDDITHEIRAMSPTE